MNQIAEKLERCSRLLDRALGERFDERIYLAKKEVDECIDTITEAHQVEAKQLAE